MRISMSSFNVLATHWPISLVRATVALLLAAGIVVSTGLHADGFIGVLGLYSVTDGALTAMSWFIDRRFKGAAVEGALGLLFGLAIMLASGTAVGLLFLFALRAVFMAGAHAWSVRNTLSRSDAKPQLAAAGVCGALGVGFLVTPVFGYSALDLYACIAGYLAIAGAMLAHHGLVLRRWTQPSGRGPREHGTRQASRG